MDRDELLGLMQDSLAALAVELGLRVASAILEDEVTRLCGTRSQRQPGRAHTRYGHQRGVVILAGQKLPIERPRVRRAAGGGEVPLETYTQLQSPDAFPQAVLRRMVRGVSTREYEHVVDMARDGFGVAKSSVSRGFVRASAANVKKLAERRIDSERFAVVMIDGVEYAAETMIEALGITEDGVYAQFSLWRGNRYAGLSRDLLSGLAIREVEDYITRPGLSHVHLYSAGRQGASQLHPPHSELGQRGV
jgi:transposase-like protein